MKRSTRSSSGSASEELTARFAGEPQAVHVLCLGITPDDHERLQELAGDVEAVAEYLHGNGIACALAHPFYKVAAPLAPRHRRRLAERIARWDRGVDLGRFSPLRRVPGHLGDEAHVHVLYAGRLVREKDIGLLADAFALAHERDPRLRLSIAGGGPEQALLEARLGKLVRFHGWLDGDALATAYASADLFLFCSQTDTFRHGPRQRDLRPVRRPAGDRRACDLPAHQGPHLLMRYPCIGWGPSGGRSAPANAFGVSATLNGCTSLTGVPLMSAISPDHAPR